MRNLIIILLGILPEVLVAQNLGRNANLDSLDSYIAKQNFYDLRKEEKIHSVEKQIAENQRDNQKLYLLLGDLYNEYQSYIYDSAYVCAEKLLGIANSLNDNDKIVEAKVKIGFCYLSAGLYKEAFDILENISVKNCTVPTKIEFFICKSRLYYDLADYNRGKNFIEKYNAEGNVLLDSALNILPKNSAKYWATMALLQMKSENFQQAIDAFERLINQKESSQHDIAIATSSIAYILTLQGKKPDAQNYLVRAAIADIQSSVKETVALRNLAQLLYENGDIEHATIYVRKALQDAMFYNARQRQLEIGAILPIIEGERIKNIENQRKKMIFVSIGVGLLALILLVAIFIIYLTMRKLRGIKQDVQRKNAHLEEANKIKEELIGDFFSQNSEIIDKINSLQRWIARKVDARSYDELRNIPRNLSFQKERETMYARFDTIFLKIFPDFVKQFNRLLKPDQQIAPQKGELLNTDLRIYALMRLGIRDNEKIARFLDYSINTIYTYKTKIKNRAIDTNEEFKRKLMEIK